MDRISTHRRLALGLGAAALLVATIVGPASAADRVTQSITGAGLSASVANLTLTSVTYQNAAHDVTGTMDLTVDDRTDSGAGWNVTIMTSPFVWTGPVNGGIDIPAANFVLTSAAVPVSIAGQAVFLPAATGPQVPPLSPMGALSSARKTIAATATYGMGTYTQALGVTLTIPAMSHVGTYTATLTTTITSAP